MQENSNRDPSILAFRGGWGFFFKMFLATLNIVVLSVVVLGG